MFFDRQPVMVKRATRLALLALLPSLVWAPCRATPIASATNLVGATRGSPADLFVVYGNDPGTSRGQVTVHGMLDGETIEAFDFGPVDGKLYAIGSTGRLYTVDETGKATLIAAGIPLSGTDFGMDFNGLTGSIDVVSVDRSSFTVSAATGLATPAAPVAYGVLDPHFGTAPQLEALASPAGSGVVYGIDRGTASLVLMAVPALGSLTTIGALGIQPAAGIGFDIGIDGTAWATFRPSGALPTDPVNLYTINLVTGAATLVGPMYQQAGDVAVAPAGYKLPPVITANSSGAVDAASLALLALAGAARRRRRAAA
jgi:hypothetical protein